jgi:hypothetical protein
MSKHTRPPLTPADSRYVGTNGRGQHVLVWPSQSRPDRWHHTWGNDERAVGCSCEAKTHSPARACKHQLAYPDALRHHLDPPPADPGGAALDAAQGALDGETADWRDELPRNFGTVAVTPELLERAFGAQGAPPLAAVAVSAWGNLPGTLDEAVADDGDRWIQSRAAAGIRLTCTACHDVRGWATEAEAVDWLARDGRCGCGGGAPTPPAPGAARRPMTDLMADLYESAPPDRDKRIRTRGER